MLRSCVTALQRWLRATGMPDMAIEINWHSTQGTRTRANQDYCGVGVRPDAVLCVVLDGSTTGSQSGKLVRLIAGDLADWFTLAKASISADDVVSQLREIHNIRSRELPMASASYLVTLIRRDNPSIILHAGDCLIGNHDDTAPVEWLVTPHTLANAIDDVSINEIAPSPLRNKLTRSFRAKEFMIPETTTIPDTGEAVFVVATDGFWAELTSDQQHRFLDGEVAQTKDNIDDCSVLRIRIHGSTAETHVSATLDQNLHVVKSS